MESTIHEIELKLVAIETIQEQQTQTLKEIKDILKCIKDSTSYEFMCDRFPTVDSFDQLKSDVTDIKEATKYDTLSKVYVTLKEFLFVRWAVYSITGVFLVGMAAAILKLIIGNNTLVK